MQTIPSPINTAGMLLRPRNKNAAIHAVLTCSNALVDTLFTDRLFKMSPEIESVRKLKVHLYQGDYINHILVYRNCLTDVDHFYDINHNFFVCVTCVHSLILFTSLK